MINEATSMKLAGAEKTRKRTAWQLRKHEFLTHFAFPPPIPPRQY
jgi:hypothetical protein